MFEAARRWLVAKIDPRKTRAQYDAGGMGRRLRTWAPGMLGPNAAMLRDLSLLRERSRDAVRNNAWITQGINNATSNEIGCGITPRSTATNRDFADAANELWDAWTKVADADGRLDFYGLQAQLVRGRREAGESFVRIRARDKSFGLPVPFQIQALDPEFCPHDYHDSAKRVRAGVEFSAIGRRTAYWMYRAHPGDGIAFANQSTTDLVPVPAASVLHHYHPLRPGQIRGIPWTVQALIKAKDFDEYDDAELVRKKSKSAYTGIFTRQQFDDKDYDFDPFTGAPLAKDGAGTPMMQVEPGTLISALPGEDFKLFDGDQTGSGYADFCRQQLLGAAAALGIPYEFLTGDMSKVNDRLMRVIYNEYHRLIEQAQWHLVIPQFCQPVWEAFVDFAVLAGALPAPNYAAQRADYQRVEWQPYRWPYLNPLQDVEAAGLEIRYGLQSRSGAAAERGLNAEAIDKQNAADKERAESLGLNYDLEAKSNGQKTRKSNDPDDPTEEEEQQQRLRRFLNLNRKFYRRAA